MNTKHPTEGIGQPTTTEELIVQYLDGELVRKELETVLFERLAHSTEARALLREYLTVRGAIRVSLDDSRFLLSQDLDAKTRARIEQLLAEGIAIDETAGIGSYAADAPPVVARPTTTRLKRWSLRPSIALLALLFAVGTTWFVTRTSAPAGTASLAPATPALPSVNQPAVERSESRIAAAQPQEILTPVLTQKSATPRVIRATMKSPATASVDLAQTSTAVAQTHDAPTPEVQEPNDIMLSHRYAKMLNATEKREIVVTSRDRL